MRDIELASVFADQAAVGDPGRRARARGAGAPPDDADRRRLRATDDELEAMISAATRTRPGDDRFWEFVDAIVRLRVAEPEDRTLAIEILDVVGRHAPQASAGPRRSDSGDDRGSRRAGRRAACSRPGASASGPRIAGRPRRARPFQLPRRSDVARVPRRRDDRRDHQFGRRGRPSSDRRQAHPQRPRRARRRGRGRSSTTTRSTSSATGRPAPGSSTGSSRRRTSSPSACSARTTRPRAWPSPTGSTG